MQKPDLNDLWEPLEKLIREAGAAIMDVYNSGDIELEFKDGKFPVTKADVEANKILTKGLEKITPNLRILSEESDPEKNKDIVNEDYYWCIDPLDGTAEFVAHREQFVVNIGLIGPDGPVAGMVYAPVFDSLYWAEVGGPAWVKEKGKISTIHVSTRTKTKHVAKSFSKMDFKTKTYIDEFGEVEITEYGGSFQLISVANGDADIYPRLRPLMEWDTAAPHAIVVAAGGKVVDFDGNDLKYRKLGFKTPGFICYNGKLDLPDFNTIVQQG